MIIITNKNEPVRAHTKNGVLTISIIAQDPSRLPDSILRLIQALSASLSSWSVLL